MAKAVIVALSVDIPDAEQGQNATVTLKDGTTYAGIVTAIVVYTPPAAVPVAATIKLTGPGLTTS